MEEDCLPLHSENDEYIRALERVSESCAICELTYITSDYNLSEIFWINLRLYLYRSLSLPDRGDINTMLTLRGDVPQTGSQAGITSKSIPALCAELQRRIKLINTYAAMVVIIIRALPVDARCVFTDTWTG